jgi:tetratricopeptide (TPR) repeat protein
MPGKEGIMETDVDALLSLLQGRGRISIIDAATELGVTQDVVEEWARYFEEEGLISIDYEFTTPFIKIAEKGAASALKSKDKKTFKEQMGLMSDKKSGIESSVSSLSKSISQSLMPSLKSAGLAPVSMDKVTKLMSEAQRSVEEGEFLNAKELYRQLYDAFNSLPAQFISKMNDVEDDLIKLNNEIVVKLENKLQEDMRLKQSEIMQMLKEAYKLLKLKKFDDANTIYDQIKMVYKQLPPGFYVEKNALTKKVLEFYENLNSLRGKLATDTLNTKSILIERQIAAATVALKANNPDEASMAYSLAREAYTALPEGFFEEKIMIQQKLLDIHQQIMDSKKHISGEIAHTKLQEIKMLLDEIKVLIKTKDVITAVQKYSEIKEIYSMMPKGFIKNEHELQNEILKTYKEISTVKNNLALDAIHHGQEKIMHYLKKGRGMVERQDFDLAFQYYRQSVEIYNSMPKGFDKTKVDVRNAIYDAYFEIVSHSDTMILGELEGYAKEKYFTLLRLIVDAYEVVDSGRLSILPDVYKSIFLLYQELPLSIVSKKTHIKEGVKNIYMMYKLYNLVEKMGEAEELRDYSGVEAILIELSGLIEQVIAEVPNSETLINYAKSKLSSYQVKYTALPKQSQLLLPEPFDNRKLVEDKLNKAMNYMTVKNYAKASAYVNEILRIDPQNTAAKAMVEEIDMERAGKGMVTSKLDEKLASAVIKLDEQNYEAAISEAQEVLAEEPDNIDAYLIVQKAKAALRPR